MLIISDTSPIINLATIGYLHLLPDLFTEIAIPTAVYNEIVIQGKGEPGANEIKNAKWVRVIPVSDYALLNKLIEDLDPGEAEAIVLAIELSADYILIDESLGRAIAESYHLKPLGVLGVLLRAKTSGLILSVRDLMDRLRIEANFYIDKTLYQYVVKTAGE